METNIPIVLLLVCVLLFAAALFAFHALRQETLSYFLGFFCASFLVGGLCIYGAPEWVKGIVLIVGFVFLSCGIANWAHQKQINKAS